LKRSKMAILAILLSVIVIAAPASAFITSQNTETKAERMVEVAANAQEAVMEIVAQVEANTTAWQMLLDADLDEQFYGNVSLCVEAGTLVNGTAVIDDGEGWTYLTTANQSLEADEYEDAIDNAREALAIFRDVLRSINDILFDAGIETDEILDAYVIQEAIDRSRDRITQLQALIDDGHELEGNLTDAEALLDEAQAALDAGELEDAKDALIEANAIISYVCGELRAIAKDLNPGRIQSYLVHARQYRERFRQMFGQASDENIDVDAVAQALGYADAEEFMAQLQEMIQNAQDANDINHAIKALKDFSKMANKMDNAITEEFGRHGGGNGQGQGNGNGLAGNGKGNGNMGGGKSP
jgi:tetratricopeptide (TPR) repeat protein